MQNKKRVNRKEKIKAISLIVNMILAVVAFSFLVSAQGGPNADELEKQLATRMKSGNSPLLTGAGGLGAATSAAKTIVVTEANMAQLNTLTGLGLQPGESVALTTLADGNVKATAISGSGATTPFSTTLTAEQAKAVADLGGETPPTTSLGKIFGFSALQGGYAIAQGLVWAGYAYSVVQLLGSLLGLSPGLTNAISYGAAAGLFAGKLAYGLLGKEGGLISGVNLPGGLWGATGIGIVAGLIILELTYKEESKQIVTFECYPWEAPTGGASCEKCNSDLYPCSEYRCKSLGQACQLLNAGTGQEKCAWVNPKDVNSPIIQADNYVLTSNHKYVPNNAIRPPDRGVKIVYNKATDGCVKAFTPLTFGILVNEPAQCKIDYNRTMKYDQMAYYFGNSNIYKYNHTQTLSLPSPDSINAEAPELKADGNYNLYVRCKDANGNENNDLFVFNFCVEKGPDVTAPKIEATSIANNMPFQYGLNETNLEVYVNEPAECRWDRLDMSYDNMNGTMACPTRVYEMNNLMLYKCTTKLIGLLDRQDNIFYFRCKDQPYLKGTDKENDRNANQEGYKFILKGTQPLTITDVKPNETIRGAGTLATLYLQLETDNGYNNGDAWCSYSLTTDEKDYIQMFETNSNKHRQRLDLPSGEYTYYFQCVDLGGNADYANTTFNVEIDTNPPAIVRVYKSGTSLKVITDEKSTCSYSNNEEKKCNFLISEGTNMPYANSTEHSAEWKEKNYYVKCQDLGGRQPLPDECSITVKPYNVKI